MCVGIMAVIRLSLDISYLIAPFLAWLVAGTLKFMINSLRNGKLAFGDIGYGGMPSNHSAIVSAMVALIFFKEGIGHPAFGVALTLAFIVLIDANSLRRQVGRHAAAINQLKSVHTAPLLRERMGHTFSEILAGVVVGIFVAMFINAVV